MAGTGVMYRWNVNGGLGQEPGAGTEHEIRKAIRSWKANGRPDFILYFSQKPGMPGNTKAAEQLIQVLKFKEETGATACSGSIVKRKSSRSSWTATWQTIFARSLAPGAARRP
jgi:hypothetical protein